MIIRAMDLGAFMMHWEGFGAEWELIRTELLQVGDIYDEAVAANLEQSRQQRYLKRVEIVKQCVGMYHKQYAHLRESIVAERNSLISRFGSIEAELLAIIQDDYNFFSFHASYLERSLRRYEGQLERMLTVLGDIMTEYQRHCGTIKRRGMTRIAAASQQLRLDLETSCNGLILGYTAGYAQGYFDELIYRGEVWRNTLTDIQGRLILEKEKFATAKDEIDRDLTIQVSDRLTIDRNSYKGHLESLADDTAKMLERVATTRASYASVQKDANARLVLRIEKAVRESRKLRVAAEQQAELEGPAMRDIRVVLDTARTSCVGIVKQIRETCLKQLFVIEPLRAPHRDKMETRVRSLKNSWHEVEKVLNPLIADYKREVVKHLALTKSQCMQLIGKYQVAEHKALQQKYATERVGLISAFRKHFREFDLSEATIFERFNREVNDTVSEMNLLWGPSRPSFIIQGLQELEYISTESLAAGTADVVNNMNAANNKTNDDDTTSRMEITDAFTHSLSKCTDYARTIPVLYIQEKKNQLLYIDEMSMEKNGDMVRPQVKAVLDLLLSGIEIDSDFNKGYESLIDATGTKATECSTELLDFNDRYMSTTNPLSIEYSAALTMGRIHQRRLEVQSLIDASEAHLIADHSRLDVLLAAGEKDIEEWSSLTLQLVENAFHNAEISYLSNLWPTPPTTPRLDTIGADEDRVGKLKALLQATYQGNMSAIVASGGLGLSNYSMLQDGTSSRGVQDNTELAEAILGGALEEDDEVDEAARLTRKQQRRLDKEQRRAEKERLQQLNENDGTATPPKIKPDQTRELQQGWFECCTAEGYTYYYNPATEESLWQLPQALKTPLFDSSLHEYSQQNSLEMETPRDLLMLAAANAAPSETIPVRIVPAEFSLRVVLDPAVIMSQVAEEARAAVALAMDTALDVTTVIRGKKGKDMKSIATLLGDKFSADKYKSDNPKIDSDRYKSDDDEISAKQHLPSKQGVISDTRTEHSGVSFNTQGHLLSDTASQRNAAAAASADPELAAMLLDLGLGSGSTDSMPMRTLQEEVAAAVTSQVPSNAAQWLQLGLDGDNVDVHDKQYTSSDDEGPSGNGSTAYREEKIRRLAEERYLQSRETDLMHAEDVYSIHLENHTENENCQQFLSLFQGILDSRRATAEDKIRLTKLSGIVKPINVVDILTALNTSWKQLDEIIGEAAAQEASRQDTILRLRTEDGLQRQQVILEHSEDISEMAEFLHSAGLSKTAARRVATECVLRNISTPRKLAKLWSREQVVLGDFGIDADDTEELENALRQLLMNASASTADLRFNTQQFNGSPQNSTAYMPMHSSLLAGNSSSFYLDSNLVAEVVADDPNIDQDDDYNEVQPQQQQQGLKRFASTKQFTLTKDGYKSFVGGWVEGLSDEGQVYYYNTATGQSSWILPNSKQEDEEVMIADLREPSSSDYNNSNNGYNNDYSNFSVPTLQQPTNTFPQSYQQDSYDPQQQYDYPNTNEYGAEDPNYAYNNASNYGSDYPQYDEYGNPIDPQQQQYNNNDYDNNNYYPNNDGYYDPQQQQQLTPYNGNNDYQGDGSWGIHDALGGGHDDDHDYYNSKQQSRNKYHSTRQLPVPVKAEVAVYAKKEGVARQLSLLSAQDRWQNSLVNSQHYITEQKSRYLQMRVEMFENVSRRVETRLGSFVEDIKTMQKSLKKELGDSASTERDLTRLFEQRDATQVQAEKLSFILESLEKFKAIASERYESSFTQIDKFGAEWELIRTELLQVGDIYDEAVAANLEQCRAACEHNAKLFAYDQLKAAARVKHVELRAMRNAVHRTLRADTLLQQTTRAALLQQQAQYTAQRNLKQAELYREYAGYEATVAAELEAAGYPAIDPEHAAVPEEEGVMSYLLTQVEMEASLSGDFDSILEATKTLALELQLGVRDFDDTERRGLLQDGSWFNKHRETLERHEQALHTTLTRVRGKMNEGYSLLNSRLEVLDYEVERAAEEELFQSQTGGGGGGEEEGEGEGDDW